MVMTSKTEENKHISTTNLQPSRNPTSSSYQIKLSGHAKADNSFNKCTEDCCEFTPVVEQSPALPKIHKFNESEATFDCMSDLRDQKMSHRMEVDIGQQSPTKAQKEKFGEAILSEIPLKGVKHSDNCCLKRVKKFHQ